VLIGMNDVLQAYSNFPVETEAELTVRMEAAGKRAAEQVNALADAGARVLVSTVMDMGLTPFAAKENLDHGDTRAGVLTRLTNAFNRSMRLALTNDGSRIGLLLMDDTSRSMVRVPAAYGLADVTHAVCAPTAILPDCSNLTLIPQNTVPTPSTTSYLWADATRPAPALQFQLGSQAVSRATNNPF
jgi:outer membrane lipase/esterase